MKSKECFKCKKTHPLYLFYKHSGMKDGRLNKCKECTKRDIKENYRHNIDKYKSYERSRANLPHRVKARKDYANTEEGKKAGNKAKRKWTQRNPIKRMAYEMVTVAVSNGTLTKPEGCEKCGDDTRIHGHHCDYSKPLEVMWLCGVCHQAWHRENGEALNG